MQSAYGNINRETLKKDLRTATFIIREHEKEFCFAHTSLQEYFLARYIIDKLSLSEADKKGLAMPMPSNETLDFAVRVLETERRKVFACLKNMVSIFEGGYERQATELCLGLWQRLHDNNMETPAPPVIHLEGAELSGMEIHGLNLSRALFDNADLKEISLRHVRLTSSSFKSADLHNAEFLNCLIKGSEFIGASVQGSIWKDNDVSHSNWKDANLYLADLVRCDLTEGTDMKAGDDLNIFLCKGIENSRMPEGFNIDAFTGHSSSVYSCVLTSDNKYIISGSGDNTLKIWEMETGKCIRTLVLLPGFETASWDGKRQKLLHASPSAWRWLGLNSGLKRYPIEAMEETATTF